MACSATTSVERVVKDKTLPPFAAVRRYQRLSINIGARVYLDNGQFTNGRCHDLGDGGMAIYVPLELTVGTVVNVCFQLPHSRMMFGVKATVRNCQGYRYGVEFVALTPAEVDEIKRIASILTLTS
jgi:hypothetical protein